MLPRLPRLPRCLPLAVLLVLFGPAALWAQEPEASRALKELARNARDSVVLIHILDGFGRELGGGSGFFATRDGLVVTNYHVIEHGSRFEAELADRRRLEVEGVVAVDERNDLAVLRVVVSPSPPPLPLSDTVVEMGEYVVVLGSPLGLSATLSDGIVSAVRTQEEQFPEGHEAPVLQITAAISPGSSGSPVMNLDGEVLGVAVSQYLAGQNLNFAVPAAAVRELLAGVGPGASTLPLERVGTVPRPAYLRNVVISIFFFLALYVGFRFLR